jgi:hypothetical protein
VATVTCAFAAASCSATVTTARRTTTEQAPATTTTTAVEQNGWTTLSRSTRGIAIDLRTLTTTDGSAMTLVRFLAGQVTFDLHIGSLEPPAGTAAIGPDSAPTISASEAPSVLACFNSGFKVHDHPGGIVTWGQPLTPVVPGFGTLVIDAAGHPSVGVWGQGLPSTQDPALNVRQNLQPLIAQGQVSPQVGAIAAWGFTYGGGSRVARSALGEDASGNIVYAASMSTLPVDLATALVSVGIVNAMQLDINPATLQMDTASSPGGPLVARIPGQQHPSDQCQVGSTRDFIAVLAAPAPSNTRGAVARH